MSTAEDSTLPAVASSGNGSEDVDPLNTTPRSRSSSHRYSAFDTKAFSSYTQASPSQAKKALEAHIADTDRRIREASKLGTSLLEQKKELSERLKDVEQRQGSTEIGPELRQKLAELEREYNDLGRESARAFIPKSRKSNNPFEEPSAQSALAGDSVASPSRLSVPPANVSSRKQRNSSNRVEDLAFATEISTSLLGQLRHLQNVLAEKEEQLRDANSKNVKLTADAESTSYKLRDLDENEQRYKDENWRLETQVQDLMAQAKDASLHEQKLNHNLSSLKEEKAAAEREFDELKTTQNKLNEENAMLRKKHDAELANMRRNITAADQEKESLKRKIAEVSSQNEELAKAVAHRISTERGTSDQTRSLEEEDVELGHLSSDHSPPPSPTKGTPRHGGLESETLKSSLHHAHRMIQNLKNSMHREKTEKIELRRMLQDARNELEAKRADGSATAANAGKRRKPNAQQDSFKKPMRPDMLGGAKSTREEIMEDSQWEEYDESPSKSRAQINRYSGSYYGDQSEGFETANEQEGNMTEADGFETASEREVHASGNDGFETASEREQQQNETDGFETANDYDANATETESFDTAESVAADDSEGDLTETEATNSPKRPTLAERSSRVRSSYQSTASDDAELAELRSTPLAQPPRYKLRLNRGGFRGLSETPSARDSPASFVSNSSLPNDGQNLAAELDGLGDDTSIADSTPSRSIPSQTSSPEAQYKRDTLVYQSIESQLAKPVMVDSGTMTDVFEPEASTSRSPLAAGSLANVDAERDLPTASADADERELPVPTELASDTSHVGLVVAEPIQLEMSAIHAQQTEPVAADISEADPVVRAIQEPVRFDMSPVNAQHTEPIAVVHEELKPSAREISDPVEFGMSSVQAQHTEPVPSISRDVEPTVRETPAPVLFGMSPVQAQYTEPIAIPEKDVESPVNAAPEPVQYAMSGVHIQETEPVAVPLKEAPQFVVSSLQVQQTEPICAVSEEEELAKNPISRDTTLGMSHIQAQHTEPVIVVQDAIQPPRFEISPVETQHTEPVVPAITEQYSRGLEIADPNKFNSESRDAVFDDEAMKENNVETFDTSRKNFFNQEFGRDKSIAAVPIYQTGQELRVAMSEVSNDPTTQLRNSNETSKRVPFQPVSGNATMPKPSPATPTKSEGTQTTVSSDQIDNLIKENNKKSVLPASPSPVRPSSAGRAMSMGARTSEQMATLDFSSPKSPKRPGSAGSMRKGITTSPAPAVNAPPLPPDHKELIAAASRTSSTAYPMPPPQVPASGLRSTTQQLGPQVPGGSITQNPNTSRFSTTSLAGRTKPASVAGRSEMTRRSSVSSFASEVEERFSVGHTGSVYPDHGFGTNTDPRMIQAITQTMIGEFLYKYTRKAGRGDISENRHKRFFWIHPYTRTLYWSTHDPSRANKSELKAKSVPIEAVRVVTDDNSNPPGLHPKSIVIITPGRSIKLTAPTSQRHETWFNALSYLLLRENAVDRANDATQQVRPQSNSNNYTNTAPSVRERTSTISSLTSEDISEFNPAFHSRSASRVTGSQNTTYRSYGPSSSRASSSFNRLSATALASNLVNRPPSVHVPSLTKRQSYGTPKQSSAVASTPPPAASSTTVGSIPEASQRTSVETQGTPTPVRTVADAQGFKKPARPISLSANTQTQSPASASKSGRLSSLSGRLSRQSFFGRNRSSTQLSQSVQGTSVDNTPIASPSKDAIERGKGVDRELESEAVDESASGVGGGSTVAMENVRACCDGKHDVGSLSHRHERGTSRSRSRASLSSRISGGY